MTWIEAQECSSALRHERGQIKRSLKCGERVLTEVLDEPALQTMKVADLLESVRKLTPTRASRILLRAQIGYARPVSSLGKYEWERLFWIIEARHSTVRVRP